MTRDWRERLAQSKRALEIILSWEIWGVQKTEQYLQFSKETLVSLQRTDPSGAQLDVAVRRHL